MRCCMFVHFFKMKSTNLDGPLLHHQPNEQAQTKLKCCIFASNCNVDIDCVSSVRCGDQLYDGINIVITIFDLITDILVMIEFYQNKRYVFFWLALTFVIIAHICYTLLFLIKHAPRSIDIYDTPFYMNPFCLFFYFLIISPLLPYILYWSSLPDNCFSDSIFPLFGFEEDEVHDQNYEKMSFRDWAQEKIETNGAFIIEALIQSFPEAMIQVVAIVYYKEYNNYISLTSILLSLLSVCVKSLILTEGINKTLRIFKWFCAITDFFAIFAMISWAFYNYNYSNISSNYNYYYNYNESDIGTHSHNPDIIGLFNNYSISWIGYFWIYKVLFLTFPVSICCAMGFVSYYINEAWKMDIIAPRGWIKKWLLIFPFEIVLILLATLFGLIFGTLALEIFHFCYYAFLSLITIATDNIKENEFTGQLIDFVENGDIVQDKTRLRIIKTLCKQSEVFKQEYSKRKGKINPQIQRLFTIHWIKDQPDKLNDANFTYYQIFYDPNFNITKKQLRQTVGYSFTLCVFWRQIFDAWKEGIEEFYLRIWDAGRGDTRFPFVFRVWNFLVVLIAFVFAFPFYTISRLITLLYPFLCIVVVLFGKNNYSWFEFDFNCIIDENFDTFSNGIDYIANTIPYFPGIITLIYFIFVVAVTILGIWSYKYFWLSDELTTANDWEYLYNCQYSWQVTVTQRRLLLDKILLFYNWCLDRPIIEATIIACVVDQLDYNSILGRDIANIILEFLNIEFDDESNKHYPLINTTPGRYKKKIS